MYLALNKETNSRLSVRSVSPTNSFQTDCMCLLLKDVDYYFLWIKGSLFWWDYYFIWITGLSRQEGRIYGCRPPALSIGDLNFWRSRLAADEIMICKVIKLWNLALRLKINIAGKFKFAYIGRRTTIKNTTFLPRDACKSHDFYATISKKRSIKQAYLLSLWTQDTLGPQLILLKARVYILCLPRFILIYLKKKLII